MRREMAEKVSSYRACCLIFLPSLTNLLLRSCRDTIDHTKMNKPASALSRNVHKPLVSIPFTAKNQATKLLIAFPLFFMTDPMEKELFLLIWFVLKNSGKSQKGGGGNNWQTQTEPQNGVSSPFSKNETYLWNCLLLK